ncbi:MAG: hypothetical protein K2X77_09870 [Candidatus Obscuribacterales bacterium]|jgi:predicted phosphoribosyltransferase|nr:hypothetical protein [Candidatus Obscuribacterales bacterium]
MFKNRTEAGKQLADKLEAALVHAQPLRDVVVGLPRGGVTVAVEIAGKLSATLTVLVAKKIGAPNQKEFAIGAVSSSGIVVLNDDTGIPHFLLRAYIDSEKNRLANVTKIAETEWLHSAGLESQVNFAGARAIVVDDGVATGMTTIAAERSLRALGAQEVYLAAPVVAAETARTLRNSYDQVISLIEPSNMGAVGYFYDDFRQISDEEVKIALSSYAQPAI